MGYHDARNLGTPKPHLAHPLAGANLDPRRLARGSRLCVSCDKARGYIRRRPELTDDMQAISDEFYDSIMSEPAEVVSDNPNNVIDRELEDVAIENDLPVISNGPVRIHVIPFHRESVQSVEIDGTPYVVFRPLVEAIGLDYPTQFTKLKKKSWATIGVLPSVGSNGSYRNMLAINLKTLTMWLATIDEDRVNEVSRPLVVAYQNEVASHRVVLHHKNSHQPSGGREPAAGHLRGHLTVEAAAGTHQNGRRFG